MTKTGGTDAAGLMAIASSGDRNGLRDDRKDLALDVDDPSSRS